MELVGEAVPHRYSGVVGQLLHARLPVSPVLDAVVQPPEHSCGVPDRLLRAEVGSGAVHTGDAGALVRGGDLERTAGTRRALLEDERDVAPFEAPDLGALALLPLEPSGEVEEVGKLLRREVGDAEEAAIPEIDVGGHERAGGSCRVRCVAQPAGAAKGACR